MVYSRRANNLCCNKNHIVREVHNEYAAPKAGMSFGYSAHSLLSKHTMNNQIIKQSTFAILQIETRAPNKLIRCTESLTWWYGQAACKYSCEGPKSHKLQPCESKFGIGIGKITKQQASLVDTLSYFYDRRSMRQVCEPKPIVKVIIRDLPHGKWVG